MFSSIPRKPALEAVDMLARIKRSGENKVKVLLVVKEQYLL